MKKYLLLPALFIVAAAFTFDNGKWSGYIGDSHCGSGGTGAGHASCAKKCLKEGYKPVLVVGDKAYAISNPEKVSAYVGDSVTIEGNLTNDTITVAKVTK